MELFGIIIAGIFGAIFGSYATLFAYRLPIGESWFGRYFGPKSRCPQCNTIIRTRELIPLINWLFTLGRCSSCQNKIPRIYLFIEIASTLLFVLCYTQFAFSEDFIVFSLISIVLVTLIATDFAHKIFPNEALWALLLLTVAQRVAIDGGIIDLVFSAAAGVILATIFYKIFYDENRGIIGDQKQAFSYAKFIIIASTIFTINMMLLYFLAIIVAFTFFMLFYKASENRKLRFGFFLIVPFIWLILFPPY